MCAEKIKWLSLVPYNIFPPKVGGQKAITLFNEYLSKEVELFCVTVESNSPAYTKDYTVFNTISNSVLRYINPLLFFKLRNIIRTNGITHLCIEHPYFGWLGLLMKYFCGVKLVVRSHNIEATRWKSLGKWWWKIMWYYERFVHRHANYNFFITDEDRRYAVQVYKIKPSSCATITYGIEISAAPGFEEKQQYRKYLLHQNSIDEKTTIFLFNGSLDYKPNLDAVEVILQKINPLLLQQYFLYKIIICGRGLPEAYNELKNFADKNILYTGFVDDITVYFKGADVFINPVMDGGGIKTKLVEAIGYGTPAISTKSAALGVDETIAGDMLTLVNDGDWQAFTNAMMHIKLPSSTATVFYKQFYWGNIAAKAIQFIES